MASYIEDVLIKDERILYSGHISLWSLAHLIALGGADLASFWCGAGVLCGSVDSL